MKTYPIPADLLTAIAAYLADRPWKEVANLLASINAIALASDAPLDTPLPPINKEQE